MRSVLIFDLTDEQLDQIVAARRTRPDVLANIEANRAWDRMRRRAERKAEAQRIAATHSCARCGIDTTRPDLCIDCEDVLVLEAS